MLGHPSQQLRFNRQRRGFLFSLSFFVLFNDELRKTPQDKSCGNRWATQATKASPSCTLRGLRVVEPLPINKQRGVVIAIKTQPGTDTSLAAMASALRLQFV